MSAAVEPLPFEPVTCTTGIPRSGSPSAASARRMVSSPGLTPKRRRSKSRSSASRYVGPFRSRVTAHVPWSSRPGRGAEERDQLAEPRLELLARDDHVDHPVLEQELRALEALGQLLAD